MVYVTCIEDARSLIVEGPALVAYANPALLTSSDPAQFVGAHEYGLLPGKRRERPALEANANDALDRIEGRLTQQTGQVRLLDVGSGFGFLLDVARRRGWDATGLEPLPASAAYARATFGVPVICDVLRDDTFAPQSFDVITAFQVFEHLPYPAADLGRLHRFLRPDGLILVEVPNIATWAVTLLRARHRHFVPDHLNFFSAQTLGALYRQAGIEITGHYYPARRMTLSHLGGHWSKRFLPPALHPAVDRLLADERRANRIVTLNVGDIVAVIGRRRQSHE